MLPAARGARARPNAQRRPPRQAQRLDHQRRETAKRRARVWRTNPRLWRREGSGISPREVGGCRRTPWSVKPQHTRARRSRLRLRLRLRRRPPRGPLPRAAAAFAALAPATLTESSARGVRQPVGGRKQPTCVLEQFARDTKQDPKRRPPDAPKDTDRLKRVAALYDPSRAKAAPRQGRGRTRP